MEINTEENREMQEMFDRACNMVLKSLSTGKYEESITALELVAQNGNTNAKNMLGVVIVISQGNLHEARKWFTESSNEGNQTAVENLKQLNYYCNPPGPGAMSRFDFTWSPNCTGMVPESMIVPVPYK